jgi:proteasome lid subunit RPN8/RPN11
MEADAAAQRMQAAVRMRFMTEVLVVGGTQRANEIVSGGRGSRPMTAMSGALRDRLVRWSLAAAPREACGLLLGRARAGRTAVSAVVRASNLAKGDDGFRLDPGEIVATEREARSHGLELVGFWHSHPRAEAVPSARDLREAWPGVACVIVGIRGGAAVRAWRVLGAGCTEDLLVPRFALRDAEIPPISAAHDPDTPTASP